MIYRKLEEKRKKSLLSRDSPDHGANIIPPAGEQVQLYPLAATAVPPRLPRLPLVAPRLHLTLARPPEALLPLQEDVIAPPEPLEKGLPVRGTAAARLHLHPRHNIPFLFFSLLFLLFRQLRPSSRETFTLPVKIFFLLCCASLFRYSFLEDSGLSGTINVDVIP